MSRSLGRCLITVVFAGLGAGAVQAADTEAYVNAPMPPGFTVQASEIEGPVYADEKGRTLYRWPVRSLRNGDVGERRGAAPSCDNDKYTVSSGMMSPYPPGLELPDLDTRPACAEMWPPVLAPADAKAVGDWSIVRRKNGAKQWAYEGYPLYLSVLDRAPGDVIGGTRRPPAYDGAPARDPIGPAANVPAEFGVVNVATGRMLVNLDGKSVYAWDRDPPNKSVCHDACAREWQPVLAPASGKSQGEWSVVDRAAGVKQWAFRGKPLYTYTGDRKPRSLEGSDVPGWRNVYTQAAPKPPAEFTYQDSRAGVVLADKTGRTIYVYYCGDDALDQLPCDHPETSQAYRLAICGGGDPERCNRTFPYVVAAANAKSENRSWTVMAIDPKTGKRAADGEARALRVWAYRDRPVYTFYRDRKPGDIWGDSWGEMHGRRNGFKAFWIRDDFMNGAG
ncbi:MAG: hypothetical protein AB7H70_11430 [Rhodospirillaceae bacterium]